MVRRASRATPGLWAQREIQGRLGPKEMPDPPGRLDPRAIKGIRESAVHKESKAPKGNKAARVKWAPRDRREMRAALGPRENKVRWDPPARRAIRVTKVK